MGTESKIQWTDHTWNVARGCTKVDSDCKYCLSGDTLILMADFSQKRLADVLIGDEVLSIDEKITPNGRRFRVSVVEGKEITEKDSFRITTEHSEIVASSDHMFLNIKSSKWPEVKNMRVNQTRLAYIGKHNFIENEEYKKGYICGLTDGDGTFRFDLSWKSVWKKESPQCYWRIALTDKEPLLRCKAYLKDISNVDIEIKSFAQEFNNKWKRLCKLESRSRIVLEKIYSICHFVENESFARGYLSGMFDTEGNMSSYSKGDLTKLNAVRICQKKDHIKIGRIASCFKLLGFKYNYDSCNFTLHGGQYEKFRFFQITRPSITRKLIFDGTKYSGMYSLVKSISNIGVRTLYDIQTSTGTFIANGLITHNCYMYRDSFSSTRYNPIKVVKTKTVFNLPLKLKEPSKIFTCSLTDFYHEGCDSFRNEAWDIIRKCPQHIFQILTKRPERIKANTPADLLQANNIWFGTSVGSPSGMQRIYDLLDIDCLTKFVSFEPLHERIDMNLDLSDLIKIDWAIIGGESGNETGKYRYRPCQLEWIEELIKDLTPTTAIFVKQLGTYLAKELKMSDRHGGKIEEFPERLRVREFPFWIKH